MHVNETMRSPSIQAPLVNKQLVLSRLSSLAGAKGAASLSSRLADLADFVVNELQVFEQIWQALPQDRNVVDLAAAQILHVPGKRLRPLCVVLASELGRAEPEPVRQLAVAVEEVHCATLLHDDVIDLSDLRRGQPTSRMVYGNAASIFAGDWLLIDALRRVRKAHVPGMLDQLLSIIDEMIAAEALQLELRGRLDARRETYFQVIEGKTASLFRWAMMAGGRAAGLSESAIQHLAQFGNQLGLAFQLIDDLLDLTGDPAVTGKALFTDLREGKMTFPLIVALEHNPGLAATLSEVLAENPEAPVAAPLVQRIREALQAARAEEACREQAHKAAEEALRALRHLPEGRARFSLETVVMATISREK